VLVFVRICHLVTYFCIAFAIFTLRRIITTCGLQNVLRQSFVEESNLWWQSISWSQASLHAASCWEQSNAL